MPKLLVIALCLLLAAPLNAQPLKTITGQFAFVDADASGNLYTVNGSELRKYDAQGTLMHQYSKSVNGFMSSIDVTQPMRILVFYAESNMVQFLDHQLNELGSAIDLADLSESDIEAVCASSEGGFWMLTSLDNSLQHVNASRIIDHKTESLSNYATNLTQIQLIETNQKLYLVLTDKLVTFDIFGTYLGAIGIQCQAKPVISNETIRYFNPNGLFDFNLKDKTSELINQAGGQNCKNMMRFGSQTVYHYADSVILENSKQ